MGREGLEDGAADQEPLVVELGLEVDFGGAAGPAGRLGGAQVEELAGVIPLVDGLGLVDALVALEADQGPAGPTAEHLGHLGLADPGLALEEQRPPERHRQEDRRGQARLGQVAVLTEGGHDLVHRGGLHDGLGGGSGLGHAARLPITAHQRPVRGVRPPGRTAGDRRRRRGRRSHRRRSARSR